jgi:hypothetical protein
MPNPPILYRNAARMSQAALLLCALGVLAIGCHFWHTEKHVWRPLKMPLNLELGQSVEQDFTAQLDEAYEIEVEFNLSIAADKIDRLAAAVRQPSALDLNWSVHQGTRLVAQGNCRDYLYIKPSSNVFYKKWGRMALNVPYHQDIPGGGGVISRGVGQFHAQASKIYTIRAQVGETVSGLQAGQVHLGVRVNRSLWTRIYDKTKPLAIGGFIALGLGLSGLAGLGAWGLVRRRAVPL